MKASLRCLATLGALLLSSSGLAEEKTRVVVMGIGAADSRLTHIAESIAEQVLTELQRVKQLEVMGTSDVTALLGVERQKALLGCSDSSSCLVEISAALGAPWLVSGTLAQSGKTMRFDLKLIRAKDGKVVFRDGEIIKDESAVFDVVSAVTRRMLPQFGPPDGAQADPGPGHGPGVLPWVMVGTGAVVMVGGGVLLLVGNGQRASTQQALAQPPGTALSEIPTYTDARASLQGANTMMVTGGVIAGVGAAAVIGGLVWRFAGHDDSGAQASWSVSVGPASVQVGGAF